MNLGRSLVALLLVSAWAHLAAASPIQPPETKRRMIGILDVRVDGVPSEMQAKFERGLEEQLDTSNYWLSTRDQMRERMRFSTKWAEGCLVGTCLGEVRTQTNAELVLLAALNGSGTSFGYVITVVRTDTGRVVAQESNRCDVCTIDEAMTEATLTTIRLLNALPDELPDEAAAQGAAVEVAAGEAQRELVETQAQTRRRGLTLALVGLAVAAGGLTTYFVQDKPAYAVAITAAGGGLTLGGVVVLTF